MIIMKSEEGFYVGGRDEYWAPFYYSHFTMTAA